VSLLLLLSTLLGSSRAEDPPLAIPFDGKPTTGSTTMRPPEALRTSEDLKGAMSFRSGHLEIRTITSWSGGGSMVIHEGYRWGPPGPGPRWGVGFSTVVGSPMVPEHAWAVFQGPTRLSVPAYLDLVGDPRGDDVRRRIRSNRTAGTVLATVGVVGIATVVTGLVGASTADFPAERREWNNVGLAGVGGIVVGFTGASIANGSARRLQSDYGQLGWEPTRTQVDEYNEKLRSQLGLSPDQAWRIIEEGGGAR
jgi:hypothetical protein